MAWDVGRGKRPTRGRRGSGAVGRAPSRGGPRGAWDPGAARQRGIGSGAPAEHLGGVLGFMRLLWAVDHAMRRASKRMRTQLGVTGPERLVLRLLGRFPGASAGEVASLLHLHPSTLTSVLGRLADKGLVDRRADAEDSRRSLLWLTPAGERLDRTRSRTVEASVREALAGLPEAKVDAARDVLDALAQALDKRLVPERRQRQTSRARSCT